MSKRMHIVCLDVPFPPDYGGAIEMFYKIEALSEQNVKIILHCFEYGRGFSRELERYCEQVYYYRRKKTFPISLPYIVSSRKDRTLIKRLTNDDLPVLFEGVHCTYYVFDGRMNPERVWVRVHNIESEYYRNLANSSPHFLKRMYYRLESRLLKSYESSLYKLPVRFLALNKKDEEALKKAGAKQLSYLPLFVQDSEVNSPPGRGSYCLFHGNLSVEENEKAVLFLIEKVIDLDRHDFVVAGKNPSKRIREACARCGIKLIANPEKERMDELIRNAQVHLLPSMNSTGSKVKLIHSLFRGRFVITNSNGVEGTGLENLCIICETAEEFRQSLQELMEKEFSEHDIHRRKEILEKQYSRSINGRILSDLIFGP